MNESGPFTPYQKKTSYSFLKRELNFPMKGGIKFDDLFNI